MLKNQRHERFAQAIAAGKTADEAYVTAGYKPNRGNACELKAKESITRRVEEIHAAASARVEIDVSRVLKEVGIIAFSDMKDLAAWGNDAVLTPEQVHTLREAGLDVPAGDRVRGLDKEALKYLERAGQPVDWRTVDLHNSDKLGVESRAVQSIGENQHGVSIKLHDKLKALELLGKHLRMWVDKIEASGANGAPLLPSIDLGKLSLPELALFRQLAEKAAK